ncbi:MAG: hypothetical protein IRY96_11050 [Burkholderiales bacterium]|nr:hypothetical protein [Burkholderiales bacterium]PZN01504.1 MAG: hypothetical protein DIU74_10005 [Pseudomonadota bacterium]
MRRPHALLLACLLAACATPAPQPVPEAPAVPRIGVVGLVQEQRHREINRDNWQRAIVGVIRNTEKDQNANVARMRYEVTVFFDAGEQETIVVDENPNLQPGQRVRVTGNRIEPLSR